MYEKELNDLRHSLVTRRVSCSDCQALRNDLVKLIDLAIDPNEKEAPKLPASEAGTTVADHSHSHVEIRQETPPVPYLGSGREVAPGVVIYDAPKPPEEPPKEIDVTPQG